MNTRQRVTHADLLDKLNNPGDVYVWVHFVRGGKYHQVRVNKDDVIRSLESDPFEICSVTRTDDGRLIIGE